jgi:hypothetical protein
VEFKEAADKLWPVYESRFAGTPAGKKASKISMMSEFHKESLSNLRIILATPWTEKQRANYPDLPKYQEAYLTIYFMQTPGCCGSVSMCNLTGHNELSTDVTTVALLLEYAEAIASLSKYTLAQYSTVTDQTILIEALKKRGFKPGVDFQSRRTKAHITFWSRIMDAPPKDATPKSICSCGDPDCGLDDDDDEDY